jgi:hypothetical protein
LKLAANRFFTPGVLQLSKPVDFQTRLNGLVNPIEKPAETPDAEPRLAFPYGQRIHAARA